MKAGTLTFPIVLAVLVFLFVWTMGMLTIKSGMITTRKSLHLLRLHTEVARQHDELMEHSRKRLDEHLGELPGAAEHPRPGNVADDALPEATGGEDPAQRLPERRALRPWPVR